MSIFKKTKSHSITLSRAVSEMETLQFHMTCNDPSEFKDLVQMAEDAIQVQADRFQQQLRDAADARQAELDKAATAKKKG